MKDNITDVDILWATEGYIEFIFDGILEGHAPIPPFSTRQFLFDKSGIQDVIDEEDMFGSTLWLGITETGSEIIKEVTLIGLKDNIIDGDILWVT